MAGVDKTKNKIIFGWLLDYICHMAWAEFSDTLDMSSETRDLIQAIITQDVCCETNMQQTLLLTLLSRLADGSENYDTKYDNDSNVTVLEDMLPLFDKLSRLQTDSLEKEGLDLMPIIKTEALMVSCRQNDFEMAQNVFDRQWSKQKDKVSGNMKEILQVILDSGQSNHEHLTKSCYSDFVKTILTYLSKIHANLNTPLLLKAADKLLTSETASLESLDDGMPVQNKSYGDKAFSADVIQSVAADGIQDRSISTNNNNKTNFNPSKRKMKKLRNQSVDELFGQTTPKKIKTPNKSSTPKPSSSTMPSSSNTVSPQRPSPSKTYLKNRNQPDRHEPMQISPSKSKSSSDSEESSDDDSLTNRTCTIPSTRRKWTDDEMEEFYDAVMTIGPRQWSAIKEYMGTTRSGGQLKDKWRNMMKSGIVDRFQKLREKKKKK